MGLTVMITSPTHISVQHNQLLIQSDDTKRLVPAEDISCLLIDSHRCSITTAAIDVLSSYGAVIFTCGRKHYPQTITSPFATHSRGFYRLNLQLAASVPTKKRIWQSIIRQKIQNQGQCLLLCGNAEASERLFTMAKSVKTGDSTNLEASAARIYFESLFGVGFLRGHDGRVNAALNYGYAILRGNIIRYLTLGGFHPSIGLFHHNASNNFNLADDLIEPLRPVVDLFVFQNIDREGELSLDDRKKLVNICQCSVSKDLHAFTLDYYLQGIAAQLECAFAGKAHVFSSIELPPIKADNLCINQVKSA